MVLRSRLSDANWKVNGAVFIAAFTLFVSAHASAHEVLLEAPEGLCVNRAGELFVADYGGHAILQRDAGGQWRKIAGVGRPGFSGDGALAFEAELRFPQDVLYDEAKGRLLIADTCNHRIRAIDAQGRIETIAGSGECGYTGDRGPATKAALNNPQGIALDGEGRLLIADTYNHVVRRIELDGSIATIAGTAAGLAGDGGPAIEAQLSLPMAVAVDSAGFIYISDSGNSRIRRMTPSDGKIETVAGKGLGSGLAGAGFSGDGGPAIEAQFFSPADLAFDASGRLLICDSGNHRLRRLHDGKIESLGVGRFDSPQAIAVDDTGRIYVAERTRGRVSVVDQDSLETILTANKALELPATELESRPHLIDEHLFAAMEQSGIPHAENCDDSAFLRRVSLDLTGRIPTFEQTLEFAADCSPEKRARAIDRLLASRAWSDHWGYWYGDLFRNCANRIGNATTKHFDLWLRERLSSDAPYDEIVTAMLTASAPNTVWMPDAGPAGFLARWHIAADSMYSDRPEDTADEIAIQASRFFLGINYQCISCHGGRGFLEKVDLGLVEKERSDLWKMAAFFGGSRVRIVPYQDRFTITDDGPGYDTFAASSVRLAREGGKIEPTFVLTGEQADPSLPLRPQFARMLTRHPQFAKATVNLIWKQMFGVGIVEPFDGFDLARQDPSHPPPKPWTVQPSHPELLEALAADFAANGFSLKRLMRSIANSRAYQLSSDWPETNGLWRDEYDRYYARRRPRQLTAEQLHDAICEATQVFGDYAKRDMLFGAPKSPARFATEAPTPEEISDGEARNFMRAFGQASREQSDRASGGSIPQALAMLGSDFVSRRVRCDSGGVVRALVESGKSNEQLVEELFLRTLSRPGTDEERSLAVSWLTADRRQGAEDLQFSLLNKLEFLFNR